MLSRPDTRCFEDSFWLGRQASLWFTILVEFVQLTIHMVSSSLPIRCSTTSFPVNKSLEDATHCNVLHVVLFETADTWQKRSRGAIDG